MKIAFTGTRKGMTVTQWKTVQDILHEQFHPATYNEFHGGDAIGADHQTLESVKLLKEHVGIVIHGHPCNLSDQRAYDEFDVMHEVKPPLVRNRIMVDASDLVIASPYSPVGIVPRGSGTWATIRYTLRNKKALIIVFPDGSIQYYEAREGLF